MNILNFNPDIILLNGDIRLVDEYNSVVEAIAILDNKVMAVGKNKEIIGLADKETKAFDLEGKTVIPGINDSHNHAWEAGSLISGLVTFGIKNFEELREKIQEKLEELPDGAWLQGGGWNETQFIEGRMPTKNDIDIVSPNNPVVLERIFSTCVVNSKALELAGITKDTPDPYDGKIGRDGNGEPTGLLFKSAKQLVRDKMPGPLGADELGVNQGIESSILVAHSEYLKHGITSIVEPGVTPAISRAYQNLYLKGELKVRTNLMPNWYGFHIKQELEKIHQLVPQLGIYTGFGDAYLRIGGLKMAIDGGLTSKTALLSWPYAGEEKVRVVDLRLDLDELDAWVAYAHNAGWSVGIHVVGDVSQDKAVSAIYKAYKNNPQERRHQIIHGYYPTQKSLAMMKEAKIIAAVQPAFIYGEAAGYDALMSKEKQEDFTPLKTYLENGIITAISTDMPSAHFNPFYNFYSAVTRKGALGHQAGDRECIEIDQAIRMMTYNGAYLTNEENIKGCLTPGMLADLIVLDCNLGEIDKEEIKDIKVKMTIANGEIVYVN